MTRAIAIMTGATLFSATLPALSADCPDFGLPEAESVAFCDEFRRLLYAPYDPGGDRGAGGGDENRIDRILNSDPLWGEVYRSDPKQTVELIERIRDAGGLQDF